MGSGYALIRGGEYAKAWSGQRWAFKNWEELHLACQGCGSSVVKNPPAMWETCIRSLGREDYPGVGNGTPLQYSCLENPMDRGVHGVTESAVT